MKTPDPWWDWPTSLLRGIGWLLLLLLSSSLLLACYRVQPPPPPERLAVSRGVLVRVSDGQGQRSASFRVSQRSGKLLDQRGIVAGHALAMGERVRIMDRHRRVVLTIQAPRMVVDDRRVGWSRSIEDGEGRLLAGLELGSNREIGLFDAAGNCLGKVSLARSVDERSRLAVVLREDETGPLFSVERAGVRRMSVLSSGGEVEESWEGRRLEPWMVAIGHLGAELAPEGEHAPRLLQLGLLLWAQRCQLQGNCFPSSSASGGSLRGELF